MPDQLTNTNELSQTDTTVTPSTQQPQMTPPPIPPTTPPTTSTVVVTDTDQPKPRKGIVRKLFLSLLVIVVALAAIGGGVLVYNNFLGNPLKLVANSFSKLTAANSFTSEFSLAEIPDAGLLSLTLNYQKSQSQFSRAELKLSKIGNDPSNNFSLSTLYKKDEFFLLPIYSKFTELETQMGAVYPDLFSLQTYTMLRPVLLGQNWLHIKIPAEEFSKMDQEKSRYQITENQQKDLEKKFINSILVRSYNRNFSQSGQKYYRIVLGLKKKEAIELIESLKSLNLDINVSDLNDLIKIVESVDNWNDDLVEFLIEKKTGNLYSLSLSFPEIPKEVLEKSATKEGLGKPGFSLSPQTFSENIQRFFQKNKTGKLVYIGKIVFTNYDVVVTAERPTDVVEFENVLSVAQTELLPLVQQMLGSYLPSEGESETQ